MKPLPLIYNPMARGGRSRVPERALREVAEEYGYRLELWPTQAPGHARELAAQAREVGYEVVAVFGGDGTYNEAASGLVNGDTAMVVLPGGTTSVLVYDLGLPRDVIHAFRLQLGGKPRKRYLGSTDKGQIFLLMLSVGPDALILYDLPWVLKRYAGKVGITLQAFWEFFFARLPRFQVHLNGKALQAGWCIVGKGRFYGGPFAATPGANPFAPGLEVVVHTRWGRRAAVPFFFGIPFGKHLQQKDVFRWGVGQVVITGEGRIPYQLDGDQAGFLPVKVTASQDFVLIMMPDSEPVS